MYITNIFFGPVSKVTHFEYVGPTWDITEVAHSQKVKDTLLYYTERNGKECYIDIITKKIYPCNPFNVKEGEYFINPKHKLITFSEFLSKLHEQKIDTPNIGCNPSRRKILSLLKKCNNKILK